MTVARTGIKILRTICLVLLAAILLSCGVIGSFRLYNAHNFQIQSETGIDEQTFLEIGGLQQFVQIRGECTSNPIIVFAHGGPANPLPHLAYRSQRQLEKEYTIIHWDQRGSGRTYFANTGTDQPEVSLELILQDMDELVDYARQRFSQETVIVMGYSWGTIVGGHYVKRHPEKVTAFIAVSQIVNVLQGVEISVRRVLDEAQRTDSSDVQELTDLVAKLENVEEYNPELLHYFRRIELLNHRHLSHEYRRSIPLTAWASATSPTINLTDLRWFSVLIQSERFEYIQADILRECFSFDAHDFGTDFPVFVLFVIGDSDWITPAALTQAYYRDIDAPHKELVILEGVGHNPTLEAPEEFQTAVKAFLTDLTTY